MAFLTAVYENGLWLSWPFIALGMFLIIRSIVGIVQLPKKNLLYRVPLVPEQEIEFFESGEIDLWVDGPLLSTFFLGAGFSLTDSVGVSVPSRGNLLPIQSTSLTRGRMLARIFHLPHTGRYTLLVTGNRVPAADDGRHQLLFMRPHLLKTIGCTLGIVLGALLTVVSLVNFLMRLFQ